MSVDRCPKCKRGRAGYLGSERSLSDLRPDEIRTEIDVYVAKEDRIREYINDLNKGVAPKHFDDGRQCPECHQGWREFDRHRKDLEQLTMEQAIAALGANTLWLNALRSVLQIRLRPSA